ncbi:MAG: deoxyribodipyrimidine photo-lyase [Gammaproteobacteria bacterium]|nr:deoxyribodipyrimidine photo-lyase [Gammaproteobacteria bacterium]
MQPPVTLFWVRRDLRLKDNPALVQASGRGAVVPVFIWEEEAGSHAHWAPGAAAKVWLHHALEHFDRSLKAHGSRLIIRLGPALAALRRLISETGASAVVWNRRYEPDAIDLDTAVKAALRNDGIEAQSFAAALLNEPAQVRNQQGQPFKVFTAFWKHCTAYVPRRSGMNAPAIIAAPARWPKSVALPRLALLPAHAWHRTVVSPWVIGEQGAWSALEQFAGGALAGYANGRDRPGQEGVSRLSPYVHFGHLSPVQIIEYLGADEDAAPYIRQLYWRDFAHHLLFHFRASPQRPLNTRFERFPWRQEETGDGVSAWRGGQTGYPLVDAGMRELWQTGWMHNRVRMNAASFLVKHLLVHWRVGAKWFWDTLVDADLANNTMGWQWVAGCGADAAPYFRIFNPVLQGERFDPGGTYVRRYVPELSVLPDKWIHQPWQAPAHVLRAAHVSLDDNYPRPIVEHGFARQRALEALAAMGS